ncbi:hybrid sensor histidine kinase/response regulator transcription factor [Flammeovirga sp. OC4]|uniref:hybrid sensor histidine kinase/response regulator transcription factor n=1 Tax=Flammeovirga sp. OC4 TaxID=1382345 RepID=UPI0005C498E4|nr:hybrid sensor histidine kinase/response regulator transcription factor [Flammeovirga sp. OC4]
MKYLLTLFITFLPFFTPAQSNGYFERITSNSGLSQNDALCIHQDQKGFIWIGTNDGLNKYDGYKFKRFGIAPNGGLSLSSNLIYKIAEDRFQNLWIGTTGQGLNYFDREQYKVTVISSKSSENEGVLSSDYIKELLVDHDTLWVGTRKGLDKVIYDQKTGEAIITNILLGEGLEVNSIEKNQNGDVLIGSTQGFYLLKNNHSTALKVEDEIVIYDIIIQNNIVILATLNGLYTYVNGHVKQLNHQGYTVLLDNEDATFWAGTNQGLQLLKLDQGEVIVLKKFEHQVNQSHSLSANAVRSICKDHTGMLWVGTHGGGLNKYNARGEQFHHISTSNTALNLSNNSVKSFGLSQNNNLWIGTRKGINIISVDDIDKDKSHFKHLAIDLAVAIQSCKIGNTQKMFVGTANGNGPFWVEFDKKNKKFNIEKFHAYKGAVFSVVQDENDVLWLGTYFDGLLRFNPHTHQLTKFNKKTKSQFPSNTVRSLLEDKDHNIWVGTDKGLVKIRKEEKYLNSPSFRVFQNDRNDKTSISHDYILTLFEDKDQQIWAGTFGGGLNKLENEAQGTFKRYTESEGLPNNTIKGILQDSESNLWVSTNKGLCKMNLSENLFSVYDVSDGLQAYEFQEQACLHLKDDRMLFGGINGLNSFYPLEITSNTIAPKVRITAFYLWNKEVMAGEEIEGRVLLQKEMNSTQHLVLNHNENSVSFEFSALHFLSPASNKYQYRLIGYQDDWQNEPASRRFVSYTNLPSGEYTFEVRGANNDGIWSTENAQVNFQIKPVFWKTYWAFFIYFIIIVLLVVITYRELKKRRQTKNKRLLDQLEREKEEEVHNMKLQFFTNISHEFRTPLTLISAPLDYLEEHEEHLTNHDRYNQYALMKKNSALLLKLVNQLLDFRKIEGNKYELEFEKKDIITFTQNIVDTFYTLANQKSIEFDVTLPTYSVAFLFSSDAIEKIIYNLLSNAFKFNKIGGQVKFSVNVIEDFCTIVVQDTGKGIPSENKHKLFDRFFNTKDKVSDSDHSSGIGLSLTKSLVEQHHGSIELDESYTNGAKFIVKIPMQEEYYLNDKIIKKTSQESTDSINIERKHLEITELKPSNQKDANAKPLVMIVEDSEDMRFFLKEGMMDCFQVIEAENGKEAISLLNTHTPSLIISDIMMPVMDGIEFAKELRSNKEYDHIPFIFLTAKTAEDSQIQGLKVGADDYICKPFSMSVLHQKVNNIIAYRSSLINSFQSPDIIHPKEIEMISSDKAFLDEVTSILDDNLMDSDFNVDTLVEKIGISRTGLYHKFKDLTGLSAGDYIRRYRLMCAHQYLEKTDWSIKEVMYRSGFNTTSYFAKCFKKQYGILPSEFREKFETHEE